MTAFLHFYIIFVFEMRFSCRIGIILCVSAIADNKNLHKFK